MKESQETNVDRSATTSSAAETKVQPLVFVLILNFNSFADTIECVKSVRASDYRNIKILVMDNASPDGSGERLKALLPQGEFHQFETNTGYAGGNNFGFRRALSSEAEFVFVLNPDTRLASNAISECVSLAATDFRIGAINPVQLQSDNQTIDSQFFNAVIASSQPVTRLYDRALFSEATNVRTLLGAALFLRASTIRQVGGFDPLYFAYGEEIDFCRRIRFHNFSLAVAGGATVKHLRTKEKKGISDFILFLRLKGFYLGILKDPGRSFRRSLSILFRILLSDLRMKRLDEYPFNKYSVKLKHVLWATLWIAIRVSAIRKSRLTEIRGCAHI